MVDVIKALNEATAADGGYFVPDEFARIVFERVREKATALTVCQQVNMKSDTWYAPSVVSGNTGYWVAENTTITGSDAQFGQISLTAKKVAALAEISTELLDDSDPSIAEYVMDELSEAIAYQIDNEIYNGDGTNFSGMRDTTTYTDIQTIAATGADGDAMSLAKITEAIEKLRTENFEADYLIIHPKITKKLRDLVDDQSRPIFDAATFGSPLLKDGVIGTVYGLKVLETTRLPVNLTKGAATTLTDVLVVQSKKCGLFGNRRQLQFNKDYQIAKDNWLMQVNLRAAFTVPYQKSICLIEDIITA